MDYVSRGRLFPYFSRSQIGWHLGNLIKVDGEGRPNRKGDDRVESVAALIKLVVIEECAIRGVGLCGMDGRILSLGRTSSIVLSSGRLSTAEAR